MTSEDFQNGSSAAPRWRQSPSAPGDMRTFGGESRLHRLLGGAPVAVGMRLLVVSLIVGAGLVWLDLRPADVFDGVLRFCHRLWMLGFDGLRDFGSYIAAGAIIVVPVWIVLRLLAVRPFR
jgi:hypothetical protein